MIWICWISPECFDPFEQHLGTQLVSLFDVGREVEVNVVYFHGQDAFLGQNLGLLVLLLSQELSPAIEV